MEPRKPRRAPAPRKRPRGVLSSQIVDGILTAAGLLLERDGIDGLTTNAVARVAGVSVGSLYQYFPDKLSIVVELARRVEAAGLALMLPAAARMHDASAREAVARIVALSASPRFGTNGLRRALLREVPRGWILGETRLTDGALLEGVAPYVASWSAEVRPFDVPRALFVVGHAAEGVVEALLSAWPEALNGAAVQRELFHLVWAYAVEEGGELAWPPVDEDLPPLTAESEGEIARRLWHEPSRRRVVEARVRVESARGLAARSALVSAGERVLAREGFEGLTVRTIAREAGVATGALYHHFAGPQAIVAEVAKQRELRAAEDLRARLASARGPHGIAEALASAHTGESLPGESLRRALLVEVPRRWVEDVTLDPRTNGLEHLATALARETSGLRPGDQKLMAFIALHAAKAAADAFVLLEPGLTRAELDAELRELVRRYLSAH